MLTLPWLVMLRLNAVFNGIENAVADWVDVSCNKETLKLLLKPKLSRRSLLIN